jgi:hypothetical protein
MSATFTPPRPRRRDQTAPALSTIDRDLGKSDRPAPHRINQRRVLIASARAVGALRYRPAFISSLSASTPRKTMSV